MNSRAFGMNSRAFGKIMMFGAYSVLVPGNICLVVNVDRGTTAKAVEVSEGRTILDMKSFELMVSGVVEGHKLNIKKESRKINFMKNAVEFSFEYLASIGQKIKDIKLTTENDTQLSLGRGKKVGFGSSASSTVAAVAAILGLHGIKDRNLVYKISQYAHFKSQAGQGSGFDISAACFGSQFFRSQLIEETTDFLSFVKSKEMPRFEEFYWPSYLFPVVAFTGRPASTKELLLGLSKFKEKNEEKYDEFMAEYDKINRECKNAFLYNDTDKIITTLEHSWRYRKELGILAKMDIESDSMTDFLTKLKDNGAMCAGLAGAGGGDSFIALCRNEVDKINLTKFIESKKMIVFDVKLVSKPYEIY
ncbi:MAG: hypothetical protein ABIJ34_07610 [archaeon]